MFIRGCLTSTYWRTCQFYIKQRPKVRRETFLVSPHNSNRSYQTGSDDTNKTTGAVEKDLDDLTMAIAKKYQIFQDLDASVILDVDEERELKSIGSEKNSYEDKDSLVDELSGLNLKRGISGVYDIEELVDVLRRDNAKDIFVASLPSELNYVDYIVVVTGNSPRHMLAIAEFVRKVFKKKMVHADIIPRIEGENSKDWIALDLGNIALHIFSKSARRLYDLDSLWGIGSMHDDLCNKPEDPLIALIEKHSVYLGDLLPNETRG